jgi:asparagine synthase (glutamine-hydrolysing)
MTNAGEDERAERFRLTPLEIAVGGVSGVDRDAPGLAEIPDGLTPLDAFEDVVRSALRRPPCVVTFSGGRDSSAVLAVAVRLAREEGLSLPIAVTVRIREAPGSGEVDWQERLIEHFGLKGWIRIDVEEEADFVGPVAQRLLLKYGVVVHPWSRLMLALQLEPARGGSVLTGFGGDAILGGWLPPHAAELRAGRTRPRLGDLPALAFTFSPTLVRSIVTRARTSRPPWVRPRAFRAFALASALERARRPARWDRYLDWRIRVRYSLALEWALSALGTDADALVFHPFLDRRFVTALARTGGSRGFGDRTTVMHTVFAHDLPNDVLERESKARFTLAHFRLHTREFARRWDGEGFDPELIDAEVLRSVWLAPIASGDSCLALQWAWLNSFERGLEQAETDVV